MHELFYDVLYSKDLSKAGDLFHLKDSLIFLSLPNVIAKIQEISSSPQYIHNENDQSVVEITVARVTAAVRESQSMEHLALPLVSLLESCLNHDLRASRNVQPPHAKIASDILACLFLNYTNRRVMSMTLPVAVNFLHKKNTELMRNVSSYLSLCAIENSDLLAKHIPTIIDSIIAGNYTLIRVLPLMYHLAQDQIHSSTMALALILQYCDNQEKNCLLGLFRLIAMSIDSPYILDNSLQYFLEQLKSSETATNTLKLLLVLAQKSKLLPHHMSRLKDAPHCSTTIQLTSEVILTLVQSNNGKFSAQGLNMLIQLVKLNNSAAQHRLLKDIITLTGNYPYLCSQELIKELAPLANSRIFIDKLIELNRNNTMLNKKSENKTWSMNRLNSVPVSGWTPSSKSLTKLNYDRTLSSSKLIDSPNKELESLNHLAKSSSALSKVVTSVQFLPSVGLPNTNSGLNNDETVKLRTNHHSIANDNRISVFEPYPMRDTVQHFCEKHLDKIKSYMEKLKIPLPVKCTIEERKSKKNVKLHFTCARRSPYCIYNGNLYNLKTKYGRIWIHIIFLALQSRSDTALSTREAGVSRLKNCWDTLNCDKSFLTLVTSAFPSSKDHENLLAELRATGYLNVFEFNGLDSQWNCLLCNGKFLHCARDDEMHYKQTGELPLGDTLLDSNIYGPSPVLQGALKEKKGKFKLFKRWRTRYFTLSGGMLTCENSGSSSTLQLDKIRSVRVAKSSNSLRSRSIPKAFEIFTTDSSESLILKPTNARDAETWVQALSVEIEKKKLKDRHQTDF